MRIIFRALRGSVDLAVLWRTMIPAESHGNPGSSQLLSRPCLPHPPVPSHLDRYQIIRLHSFFFAAKTTSNWSPTKAPELISLSKVRCWGAVAAVGAIYCYFIPVLTGRISILTDPLLDRYCIVSLFFGPSSSPSPSSLFQHLKSN